MSAEAWIALVALALLVIGRVVCGCVQFALTRRDIKDMRRELKELRTNHLPHILRVLKSLPCRQPRRPGDNQDCGWEKPQHN